MSRNIAIRILLLEDSAADQELITRELKRLGWSSILPVSTRDSFVDALSSFDPSLVLADFRLGQFDAASALALVQKKNPELPFILVTGTLDEESATKFLRSGASDYVLKDRLARLGPAIDRALLVKELREEKQTSDIRYRDLFEHNPIPMWIFDLDSLEILSVNATALAKFGYTRDELLQMRITDLHGSATILKAGGPPLEITLRRKDGSVLECEAVSIQTSAGGRPAHLVAARDVTERNQALRELAERENLLRRIFDAEPECVKLLDEDGRVLEMNLAGLHMIEVDSITEVKYRYVYPFILPEHRNHFRDAVRRIFQGESSTLQFEIVGSKGTHRWMDMHAVPLRDAAGQITALLSITHDVSKAKEMEEVLRQSQKMEAVGRLAGGIAHDFNNILTIIGGYASLTLELPGINEAGIKNVTAIRNGVLRAAALTRQLLAFSRKQLLQPRVFDLAGLIKGLGSLITRVIGEDVQLLLDVEQGVGNIKADPGQIEQVIMNLAVNARDAMPMGGTLRIEAGQAQFTSPVELGSFRVEAGTYARIGISDSGIGMSRKVMSHIFEPFFTTKEPGKGTGLGLSTVYGIVKQTGGAIMVHSIPGQGTTFEIYFPTVTEPVTQAPEVSLTARVGKERIMVVEDDPEVRDLIKGMLTSCGYTVVTAENGMAGLDLLEAGVAVDVILTDVVMPRMSGLILGQQIQQRGLPIKVIYMSGYTDDFLPQSEPDAPQPVHFIQKPLTQETLARTIREVLDKPRA